MNVQSRTSRVGSPHLAPSRVGAAPAAASPSSGNARMRSDGTPRIWLWGRDTDLLVFGGSAALALFAVVWARHSGVAQTGVFPEWSFVVFILLIDVAHVYATLFRTYLDRAEVRQHPLRYYGIPLLLFVVLWLTHRASSAWFWTGLAYAAVFHFVRQQAGWVALYRRLAHQGKVDKRIDDAAIYLSTVYPLVYWHANLTERRFSWFVPGDFVAFSWPSWVVDAASLVWALSLSVFALRQVQLGLSGRGWFGGKSLLVGTTAICWFVGIVATNSDFEFTVTNVIIHGVPYVVLLWRYRSMQRRMTARDDPRHSGHHSFGAGVTAFLATLGLLALLEETLWARLVYHERPWLFGGGFDIDLSPSLLHVCIAFLALPQATHYVLDGLVWRRHDTRRLPAQRWALGLHTNEMRPNLHQGASE